MLRFLLSTALVAVSLPASAAVMFFNDKAAFDAATAGIVFTTDTFTRSEAVEALSIEFDSGVVSEAFGQPLNANLENRLNGEQYVGGVSNLNGFGADRIDWTFPEPVTAVGFDVSSTNTNNFDDIGLTVDGETSAFGPPGDQSIVFFGFVSDTPVETISFSSLNPNFAFSFVVDDLQFGAVEEDILPPAGVPLPAGLPLLAAGLAALALAGRRRT